MRNSTYYVVFTSVQWMDNKRLTLRSFFFIHCSRTKVSCCLDAEVSQTLHMECTGSTSFGEVMYPTWWGEKIKNRNFSLFFWLKKRRRKWHTKQFSYLNVFIVLQFLRLTPRVCAPTSVSLLYLTLSNRNRIGQTLHVIKKGTAMRSDSNKWSYNTDVHQSFPKIINKIMIKGLFFLQTLTKKKTHILNECLQPKLSRNKRSPPFTSLICSTF